MAGKIDLEDSNWCEQVFEKRNRTYGAYDLRKQYSKNMKLGTVLAIVFFSLGVASPIIAGIISGVMPEEDNRDIVVAVEVMPPPPIDKMEPPPPPPPAAPPPPPVQATIKFTPPVIKKDEEVRNPEPPPLQEEMKEVQVATKTDVGTKDAPPVFEEPIIVEGPKEVTEDPQQVFMHVEEMPEFVGGVQAMYKYIGKNLRYPAMARENGVKGRVTVKFVVERDGSVTGVEVVRGIGGGCDEEAIRVVKSMPHWKAGKQNGKGVRVSYTIPITFKLDE